ncbi:hypothetical protein EB796_010521 [Bugula neritina]|uniref:Large ribosomal subunit protein mL42 n=1 Tax=Bugula neritina TaxID=10212 RepID=A0A7J7JZ11_BUGNE|nr:hypothetical protein EB796_010521 [Bugula neritina]
MLKVRSLVALLNTRSICSPTVKNNHVSTSAIHSKSSHEQHVVTTTKQGDVVLFWHPEKKMPFELSKPMPRNQQALAMGDSPLKVKRVRSDTSQVGPTNEQLSEMFFVTKHEWRLRPQLKRAKTNTPKERNAL